MCEICAAMRPTDEGCAYQGFDPGKTPAYGETWAEWIEAPNFAHLYTDRGYMTTDFDL